VLEDYAKKNHKIPEFNIICQNLSTYQKVRSNPKETKIKSLQLLPEALKQYIKKYAYKFMVGEINEDSSFVYYLVTNIRYVPRDTHYDRPANVTMSMKYVESGSKEYKVENRSITWHTNDLVSGITAGELLTKSDMTVMTEEGYKEYGEQIKLFMKYRTQIGEQFTTTGMADVDSDGYGSNWQSLSVDGMPTKLVCDENRDQVMSDFTADCKFWSAGTNEDDDDDEIQDEDTTINYEVPVHPYLKVFDLNSHCNASIHVSLLKPYVYDPTVYDKLVLPDKVKNLISVLVQGTDDIMEDIIKGKTGGIIVAATGDPGIGKTLTAEVYSEVVKRPLYVVQSSQLGIDADGLEKTLKEVLARANKWRAILLIDECDVYVRKREQNIKQNAIVGVFLRVLEYYRGILFMTSNRGTEIDDAILSRTTAHIRYPRPTLEDQKKIWKILSTQYKIDLPDKMIDSITKKFSNLSGRDIKTLLKLGNLIAKRDKKKLDADLIEFVSQFHNISIDPSK
jgi:MoxR-like ATPase